MVSLVEADRKKKGKPGLEPARRGLDSIDSAMNFSDSV